MAATMETAILLVTLSGGLVNLLGHTLNAVRQAIELRRVLRRGSVPDA